MISLTIKVQYTYRFIKLIFNVIYLIIMIMKFIINYTIFRVNYEIYEITQCSFLLYILVIKIESNV